MLKKDNGIYDAFNNGMRLAKGDYLGFLNSDDIYTENALELLNVYIKNNPSKDFILEQLKNIGEFYMDTNPIKFFGVGAFIQVILLVFLLKKVQLKK